jgi:hypothetical protein
LSDLNPLATYATVKVDPIQQAYQVLETTFGYTAFRDGQEEAISHILNGRDCLIASHWRREISVLSNSGFGPGRFGYSSLSAYRIDERSG